VKAFRNWMQRHVARRRKNRHRNSRIRWLADHLRWFNSPISYFNK